MLALQTAESQINLVKEDKSFSTNATDNSLENILTGTEELWTACNIISNLKEKYEQLCESNQISPDFSSINAEDMNRFLKYKELQNRRGLLESIEDSLQKDDQEQVSENVARGLQR